MEQKTEANFIGIIVFVVLLGGSNLVIEITSLQAFVTFFFSAFLASYIADQINPV